MKLASWTITSVSSSEGDGVLNIDVSSCSDDLSFIKVFSLIMRDRCGLVTPKSYRRVSFCLANADLRGCRQPALSGTTPISFPRSSVDPLIEFCIFRDSGLLSLGTDELEYPWAGFGSDRQSLSSAKGLYVKSPDSS